MVKRTRKEQNAEPIAEEDHYRAKKRRLAYGDVASVTCRRNLFPDLSQKKLREEAIAKNSVASSIDPVLTCKRFGDFPEMMNL